MLACEVLRWITTFCAAPALEYPHTLLAEILAPELPRFEVHRDGGAWVARDTASDHVHRATTGEELLRMIAMSTEGLALDDRPLAGDERVLVAETQQGPDGRWLWVIFGQRGSVRWSPRDYPNRALALMALHGQYD